MSSAERDDAAGRRLAAAIAEAGGGPPVLVVADTEAVGRLALAWMHSFDEAGWLYRVRSFGGAATPREIEALTAEARSLGATSIAAIGTEEVLAAGEAVAAALGIPSSGHRWAEE